MPTCSAIGDGHRGRHRTLYCQDAVLRLGSRVVLEPPAGNEHVEEPRPLNHPHPDVARRGVRAASTGRSIAERTSGTTQSQPMGLVTRPLAMTMKCRWQPVE